MAKKKTASQIAIATESDKNTPTVQWIDADTKKVPFISVDKQLRLYFNSEARDILKSKSVMLGYDHANKRIIVGNPNNVRPVNVKPHNLDKRGYTSARPFIKALGITMEELPLKYEYIGKDYTIAGAHAFELVGDESAGGDGKL